MFPDSSMVELSAVDLKGKSEFESREIMNNGMVISSNLILGAKQDLYIAS